MRGAFRRTMIFVSMGALVFAATACTVPRDESAHPIDPARLDTSAANKTNCTQQGIDASSIAVSVYLVRQQGEPPYVTPVVRYVNTAAAPSISVALNALFTCLVTEADRREGLATFIPEETQLLGVEPDAQPGVYEVRLGPLRNRGAQKVDDLDKVAVAQIFFTALTFAPELRGLRFSVDGRPFAVNTDARTVGQSDIVMRTDFCASSPRSAASSATPSTCSPVSTATR